MQILTRADSNRPIPVMEPNQIKPWQSSQNSILTWQFGFVVLVFGVLDT